MVELQGGGAEQCGNEHQMEWNVYYYFYHFLCAMFPSYPLAHHPPPPTLTLLPAPILILTPTLLPPLPHPHFYLSPTHPHPHSHPPPHLSNPHHAPFLLTPSHPPRYGKPFNPLLGETYELVNEEGQYCALSEQVSHHPPVTALHVESEHWTFWEEYTLDIKFRGQWVKVLPTGLVHFMTRKDGYHYTWNKPHTTIHNIILGSLWADHVSRAVVTSLLHLT